MALNTKPRVVNDITEILPNMRVRLMQMPEPTVVDGRKAEQFLLYIAWEPSGDIACAVCGDKYVWADRFPARVIRHDGRFRPICDGCSADAKEDDGTGPLLPLAP
ncbi:hypothetical protein [Pseudaminobacter sp. NGMCC 1.201702]|uniref:hypothetical protein n=1 Tax=Pseudaminobacter sp. NGMCC 1.201702 TaxID=3391825 RepID=UPI0039EF2244